MFKQAAAACQPPDQCGREAHARLWRTGSCRISISVEAARDWHGFAQVEGFGLDRGIAQGLRHLLIARGRAAGEALPAPFEMSRLTVMTSPSTPSRSRKIHPRPRSALGPRELRLGARLPGVALIRPPGPSTVE